MNSSLSRHIPNLLTCLNLVCGCLAVVFVFEGNIPVFAALVGCSLIFDFFDGFAARRLKAYSPMGKELDSLADMVSFGLVPGVTAYHLFINSVPLVLYPGELWAEGLGFFPFILTVFAALRLAKFNIDTRQTNSFIGLPTPAMTIFVIGIALILYNDRFHLTPAILNSYVIAGLTMIFSYLMVSDLPLIALKFRSFAWGPNKAQYLLIVTSALAVGFLGLTGIPVIILLYLILSFINHYFHINSEPPLTENS